ncbi:MAG: molybdopterin-synthase adenylyltransferase MoeB [Verrucomicrobiota bacterium]
MLSAEELSRYSRHLRLPGVGIDGQAKLKSSRVLVIGMGGLGSPASLYLAAAGVGTLGLADFDTVEAHNLQRQILHTEASVNHSKLDSATARLEALNSNVQLELYPEGITIDNAIELISQYDLVVDGSDNFPTRYLVNDAAYFARRPLIYGSIFQFEGQVSRFDPASGGPCYRCLFPQMPAPGTVPNCDEAGVFGALCGIVGSMQAMEALKTIMGIGEGLLGKLLVIDTLGTRISQLQLKPNPACPLCGTEPSITALDPEAYSFNCETTDNPTPSMEIDIHTTKAKLESGETPLLVDVREAFELEICHLDGARHIPLGQLPDAVESLPKDRELIIFCHHGGRSLKAAQFLHARGLEHAVSMRGGIHAWAETFEPQMARY